MAAPVIAQRARPSVIVATISLPLAANATTHPTIFYVTIKLYDSSKTYEPVFVRVNSWKGESIQGILASGLSIVHNHSKGEELTCHESEILDWTISKPDGTEEGNFVGKFLDTYQP